MTTIVCSKSDLATINTLRFFGIMEPTIEIISWEDWVVTSNIPASFIDTCGDRAVSTISASESGHWITIRTKSVLY
jgi:hypothetical protein